MTELRIPDLCLVALVGASGSGKSTFAAKHFLPTEVISSDACRGLVADDPNDQSASRDAFELVHFIAGKRLERRNLAVIDATSVQRDARAQLVKLARAHDVLPVAIVLDVPERTCIDRNAAREGRDFGAHVVRGHVRALRKSIRGLKREGFRRVHVLKGVEATDAATVVREPLWNDKRDQTGPFDFVGDVHGCFDELATLMGQLGWELVRDAEGRAVDATHPEGRTFVFVGDLVDRGPGVVQVLRLVMGMVEAGHALCVNGNHEAKLKRKLDGKNPKIAHGLAETLEQLEAESDEFVERVRGFLHGLISHYVLDGGALVVAHAGLIEKYQGRASGRVRTFALYGETTGESDEFGLPIRHDWASEYRGSAHVVYGHTPTPTADWINRTICLDTGCVFGGQLTALRWPEKELHSAPALQTWCEPVRPLVSPTGLSGQQEADGLLHLADVRDRMRVETRLHGRLSIRPEQSAAALETMSRFAVDPRWLIHLPPTMSPSETSQQEGFLEHPKEAFEYFAARGVEQVACEEKHMGSRAIVVLCRDEEVGRERFGIDGRGVVFTRTGRRFFPDPADEAAVLERTAAAIGDLWDELETGWLVLDCELMPWSAKARSLLESQYAPVGAAADAAFPAVVSGLAAAVDRLDGEDRERAEALQARMAGRSTRTSAYSSAWAPYCWEVASVDDYRLAPFHVLASEGGCHVDRDHTWHMGLAERIASTDDPLLMATEWRTVTLASAEERQAAIDWWLAKTSAGGEGMVVKPMSFVARGPKGLIQPAVKCRGREYLRIIYGPEYDAPEHLERLRKRGLGRKRSLALREFSLGVEALERFVRKEPLRRVHECAFGVLALEADPVDPRL